MSHFTATNTLNHRQRRKEGRKKGRMEAVKEKERNRWRKEKEEKGELGCNVGGGENGRRDEMK